MTHWSTWYPVLPLLPMAASHEHAPAKGAADGSARCVPANCRLDLGPGSWVQPDPASAVPLRPSVSKYITNIHAKPFHSQFSKCVQRQKHPSHNELMKYPPTGTGALWWRNGWLPGLGPKQAWSILLDWKTWRWLKKKMGARPKGTEATLKRFPLHSLGDIHTLKYTSTAVNDNPLKRRISVATGPQPGADSWMCPCLMACERASWGEGTWYLMLRLRPCLLFCARSSSSLCGRWGMTRVRDIWLLLCPSPAHSLLLKHISKLVKWEKRKILILNWWQIDIDWQERNSSYRRKLMMTSKI